VSEAVGVCVSDGESDCVIEAVTDSLGEVEPELLGDCACVLEGVADGEGVSELETLGVLLTLGVNDSVPDTLWEVVADDDGVDVAVLVPDADVVWVWLELTVELCVWLLVSLCVTEGLGVPDWLAVGVPLCVHVSDDDSDALKL
jgi:hypothetical protein